MIHYRQGDLLIRDMQSPDARAFTDAELAQGWHADIAKYEQRLADRDAGKCASLTAEYRGQPAGYVNVYFSAAQGPFAGTGIPELVDFGVLEKFRSRGIGSVLMDVAERIAAERADTLCLGVGLHSGYGSAQRLYARRGYVPDGSGAWYGDAPCAPYEKLYAVDDDLVLYLSKKLR